MAAIPLKIVKLSIKSVQAKILTAEENFVYYERHKIKLTLKIYHKALEFCDGNSRQRFHSFTYSAGAEPIFVASMESEIEFIFVLFSWKCLHSGTRGSMYNCSASSWIDSTRHNPKFQNVAANSQTTSYAKMQAFAMKTMQDRSSTPFKLPPVCEFHRWLRKQKILIFKP